MFTLATRVKLNIYLLSFIQGKTEHSLSHDYYRLVLQSQPFSVLLFKPNSQSVCVEKSVPCALWDEGDESSWKWPSLMQTIKQWCLNVCSSLIHAFHRAAIPIIVYKSDNKINHQPVQLRGPNYLILMGTEGWILVRLWRQVGVEPLKKKGGHWLMRANNSLRAAVWDMWHWSLKGYI